MPAPASEPSVTRGRPALLAGALAASLLFLALSRAAAAHPGHGTEPITLPAVPTVTVFVGATILAGSLYGSRQGLVDHRVADAGLVVGLLATATGLTWFWI